MNNDLISRETLKEAIRKRLGISSLKYLTEQERVVVEEIDNAPTVEQFDDTELQRAIGYADGYSKGREARPQGDLIEYKPLDADYNIQSAVENLRTTYWSDEPEKVAKAFFEAEDIIISAICHHGYTVCKESEDDT